MADGGVSLAFLTAVAANVGIQHKQQKRVEKAQEKQSDAEQAIQASNTARERRRQIAQRQVLQAQIANQAAQSGEGGSSATQTAYGDISSQTGGNLGQINTDLQLSNDLFSARQGVADASRVKPFEAFATTVAGGVQSAIGGAVGNQIGKSLFKSGSSGER